jgi:protein-tyrosine phosphatase
MAIKNLIFIGAQFCSDMYSIVGTGLVANRILFTDKISCLMNTSQDSVNAMIDWHCHILPEIDDGATDIEKSFEMATLLYKSGFRDVYCTPHLMKGCYEVGNGRVRQAVSDLQGELDRAGMQLKLHPSREYFLDEFLMDYLEDPLPLGDSRSILVEIPPHITVEMVRQLTYSLVRSGFTPVIAHPERCHLLEPAVRRADRGGMVGMLKRLVNHGSRDDRGGDQLATTGNALLDYLRDLGCHFQGNLGSFSGFYGRHVKTVAEALHSRGVYDRFGSDLHAPEHAVSILVAPFPH